jgi:hypothetical protein
MRSRDVIGVMLIRIAIRNICSGLYSGLRGPISPGGGVHYEGVFLSMRLRNAIGAMSFRIAIRDICHGLYSGLRGQYLPVGRGRRLLFGISVVGHTEVSGGRYLSVGLSL